MRQFNGLHIYGRRMFRVIMLDVVFDLCHVGKPKFTKGALVNNILACHFGFPVVDC